MLQKFIKIWFQTQAKKTVCAFQELSIIQQVDANDHDNVGLNNKS